MDSQAQNHQGKDFGSNLQKGAEEKLNSAPFRLFVRSTEKKEFRASKSKRHWKQKPLPLRGL